jgi:hypothetical protein
MPLILEWLLAHVSLLPNQNWCFLRASQSDTLQLDEFPLPSLILFWIELCSLKTDFEILTPGTSKCNHILKLSVAEIIKLRWIHTGLGWYLNQWLLFLQEEGKVGIWRDAMKKAEIRIKCLQTTTCKDQKLGRGKGGSSQRDQASDTLI